MDDEAIQKLQEIHNLLNELRCPKCGGVQWEDRNCIKGYIQYKCSCGYVEPYKDKLQRAILVSFAKRFAK